MKEYKKSALKNHSECFEQSNDVMSELDTKTFNIADIDEEKGIFILFLTR